MNSFSFIQWASKILFSFSVALFRPMVFSINLICIRLSQDSPLYILRGIFIWVFIVCKSVLFFLGGRRGMWGGGSPLSDQSWTFLGNFVQVLWVFFSGS